MANTNISAIAQTPVVQTTVSNSQNTAGSGVDFKSLLDNRASVSSDSGSHRSTNFDAYSKSASKTASSIKSHGKADISDDEITDMKDEISDKIIKSVTEDLDVSEDKLNDIMQMLGMTAIDLLQPDNLAAVFSELNGNLSAEALIVSSDFTQLYNDIADISLEYSDQLDILQQMDVLETPQVIDSIEVTLDETVTSSMQDTDTKDTSSVSTESPQEIVDDTTDIADSNDDVRQQLTDVKTSSDTDNSEHNASKGNQDNPTGTDSQRTPRTDVLHTVTVDNTVQAFSEVQPQKQPEGIDTADIIRQIAERINISNTTEGSTIEMQLNPENLGRLYINVSEKNSQITARITVTNEAVREALETQMINLRETLNNAGIKVNAVEVTVASHEFEQNLEQDAAGQMFNEEDKRNESTYFAANGDDNGAFTADDNQTEEEILAHRIMQDNGNSVDFTA